MKIIIWEDLNIESDILNGSIKEIENIEGLEDEDTDYEEDSNINLEQIITTPFGAYHIKDFFNPIRQYRWNMAHTNFDITQQVLNTLSNIPGIERILVLSRYRFLIAFGKAFCVSSVKNSIYKAFGASQPLSETALEKKKDLKSIYNKWAIYYLNEKYWDYADESSYDEKILEFRKKQEEENGIVITHETDI